MITVENAVKNASEVLYNISFSMPPYEEERTGRYYLLDQRVFASALDKLQNLDDTCKRRISSLTRCCIKYWVQMGLLWGIIIKTEPVSWIVRCTLQNSLRTSAACVSLRNS